MSLLEQVVEASGGERWGRLRRFTGHLMLGGAMIAGLPGSHSLKEVVVEGDIAAGSVRISGFSAGSLGWLFHPDFVGIQHPEGGFVGVRREVAPMGLHRPPWDEPDLVYLCGLSVWCCMTLPWSLLASGVRVEEGEDWRQGGETWRRLKLTTPVGALDCAREKTLYFDPAGMLRRTDFELDCDGCRPLAIYSSAPQRFSGLTMPTLYRALRRDGAERAPETPTLLDVEIFDAAFD
jgi:hypothetical protein